MKIAQTLKINIALSLALLFHASGLIGILYSSEKDWFIANTPVNLLLMAALIFFTHPEKNKAFFYFFFISFFTGFIAEIIGINTAVLFGNYTYGTLLGFKIAGVPLLIGLNWFVVVYCAAFTTQYIEAWFIHRMNAEQQLSARIKAASFIVDASLLTTLFDYLIEPVAIKLNYWQWQPAGEVPLYNYICWFFISAFLLIIFRRFNFNRHNQFAVHLLIIQILFFMALRIFL